MPIDYVIAKIKQEGSINCKCNIATFDGIGEEVKIFGTYWNVIAEFDQIDIFAIRKSDNKVVRKRLCDIGKICSILFTSTTEFECYN